jgi:4-amino-4-deoxy-L-arabinose transferase-like glycosyltransferase
MTNGLFQGELAMTEGAASGPTRTPAAPVRIALICLLALAPLWAAGVVGRGYWTPDEPRERAVSWRMSLPNESAAVPSLAGTPLLEKPPAYYWLAALSLRAAPSLDSAPRIPNLLYAAIAILATLVWARAAGVSRGAWLVALVSGSFLLAYQVVIWLATDVLLVACVALALLGAYRAYTAAPGRTKLLWYLLMHAAAAYGFLAKNAIAWILPALALLAVIVWERNWRELWRGELWAGLVLQVAIVGAWVLAVLELPTGRDALRGFFWYNLVGRFVALADAPPELKYADAHRNWPGKYLAELPIYLLPWSALGLAALRRSWRVIRSGGPNATALRFALGYIVAATILLSVAATARGIYYAPVLPAFAVLIGLWADDCLTQPDTFDRCVLWITHSLVAFFWILAVLVLVVGSLATPDVKLAPAAYMLAIAVVAWTLAFRAQWHNKNGVALGSLYAAFAASVLGIAIVLFPVLDRSQDLVGMARRVDAEIAHRDLALLIPDETTRAMFDIATAGSRVTVLTSADEARARLAGDPNLVLFGLLPGRSTGPVRSWLASHGVPTRESSNPTGASRVADELGLKMENLYEVPDGRRYALWSEEK